LHKTVVMAKVMPELGDSLKSKPLGSCPYPIHDVYNIGEELNCGAFGVVCKANHKNVSSKEFFAVKIKDRHDQNDENDALHEVSMLLYLRSVPNIIGLIDFYMQDDKIYIFQNLAEGGDVLDRLTEKGTYSEIEVIQLANNVAQTVESLHKHFVVHRDLKPENLLLKNHFDDTQIWLCDFGDSKILPERGGLLTFCGTPSFAAPELVEGKEYREEVDMWSFGCVLYLLLCGYSAFGDADEEPSIIYERSTQGDYDFNHDKWNDVSTAAKDVISNLLKVDRSRRWTASQTLRCDWLQVPQHKIKQNGNSKSNSNSNKSKQQNNGKKSKKKKISWASDLEHSTNHSIDFDESLNKISFHDDEDATTSTFYEESLTESAFFSAMGNTDTTTVSSSSESDFDKIRSRSLPAIGFNMSALCLLDNDDSDSDGAKQEQNGDDNDDSIPKTSSLGADDIRNNMTQKEGDHISNEDSSSPNQTVKSDDKDEHLPTRSRRMHRTTNRRSSMHERQRTQRTQRSSMHERQMFWIRHNA